MTDSGLIDELRREIVADSPPPRYEGQSLALAARARVLAHSGHLEPAESLARVDCLPNSATGLDVAPPAAGSRPS